MTGTTKVCSTTEWYKHEGVNLLIHYITLATHFLFTHQVGLDKSI